MLFLLATEKRPMENTKVEVCIEFNVHIARPTFEEGVSRPGASSG